MKLTLTLTVVLNTCLAFSQSGLSFIGKPLVNVKCSSHCCFIEQSLRIDSINRFCSYSQGITYIYRYGNWQQLSDTSIRLYLPIKSKKLFSFPQMIENKVLDDSSYIIKYSIANQKPSKMTLLGIDTILVSNDSAEFEFDSFPEFWRLRDLVANGDTIALFNPGCFGLPLNITNYQIINFSEPTKEVEFVYDLIKLPNGTFKLVELQSQKIVATYVRLEDYNNWLHGKYLNTE